MPILGVKPEQVLLSQRQPSAYNTTSIAKAYTHGLLHSEKGRSKLDKIKWLCPASAIRHLSSEVCMELITVPMNDDGPDMDMVEVRS